MAYAILLGADLLLGAKGILRVEERVKGTSVRREREFFRIREVDRARSTGSYLAVDCDIRDPDGDRVVKLFKSKVVSRCDDIVVFKERGVVEVRRRSGDVIIKVEEIGWEDVVRRYGARIAGVEKTGVALRITGEFQVGAYRLRADEKSFRIGNLTLQGNVHIGTGGFLLSEGGIAF